MFTEKIESVMLQAGFDDYQIVLNRVAGVGINRIIVTPLSRGTLQSNIRMADGSKSGEFDTVTVWSE